MNVLLCDYAKIDSYTSNKQIYSLKNVKILPNAFWVVGRQSHPPFENHYFGGNELQFLS